MTNQHERKIAELERTLRKVEPTAFSVVTEDGKLRDPMHHNHWLYHQTRKELAVEKRKLAAYEDKLAAQRAKGAARVQGEIEARRRGRISSMPELPDDEVSRIVKAAFAAEPEITRAIPKPMTMAELARKPVVPLDYFPLMGRTGWIPKGQTTMFGAPAKAGKSTLLRQWFREVLADDPELTIAIVSEEGDSDWQSWALNLTEDEAARVTVLANMSKSATDLASQVGLAYSVWSTRPGLVVMDTLPNILDMPPENDNMARTNALAPWFAIPKRLPWNPTFIGVMHSANGTGRIAGGGGTHGVPDVLLTMARSGEMDSTRKIDVVGRRVETKSARYAAIRKDGIVPVLGWTDSRRSSILDRDATLRAILEDREMTIKEWYDAYCETVDDPASEKSFRRWVPMLQGINVREEPNPRGGQPFKLYSVE